MFASLENRSVQRADQQTLHLYADLRAWRPGDPLSPETLLQHLRQRGYVEKAETPLQPGEFFHRDERTWDVFLRPHLFPDGPWEGGPHRFILKDGRVDRLQRLPEETDTEAVRLEPFSLPDPRPAGLEARPWVRLSDVPDALKKAVLVSEDRRFYSHHGLDPRAVARAFWVNLRQGRRAQGGSTLTQQLAKNAFLRQERTFRRKFLEMLLAFALEARYGKDAILEMYLNHIYLGQDGLRGLYGVEEASLSYFGKPVSGLTAGECALLAGLIPAPNAYHPRFNPDRALRRRDRALDLMREEGLLQEDEWKKARWEPLGLAPVPLSGAGLAYATWALQELEEAGSVDLSEGGYQVYLAMDVEMQQAAEQAMAAQPFEGALVALDPHTGWVKALAGSRDFSRSPFNRAVLAHRQPGSAFKPILLAAALEARTATLADLLDDQPVQIPQPSGLWEPQNYDGLFRGTVTVREALVRSLNIPAVHLLERTGADRVISLARNLGVAGDLLAVPSLALGTSEVTPLELTAAYAAFANGGQRIKPIFVLWVTDAEGRLLWEAETEAAPALSPAVAALVTDVLQEAVDRGTGQNLRRRGFMRPAAGKTGTSDKFMDAWFMGYVPGLVCGVWVGHDKPASLGRASSHLALPVWETFMTKALAGLPEEEFRTDGSLQRRRIDTLTGQLARAGCPVQREELFLPGTEPTARCGQHAGGVTGLFRRFWKWLGKPKKEDLGP